MLFNEIKRSLSFKNDETEKTEFKLKDLSFLLPYLRKHLGKFFIALLLMFIVSLLSMPGPYLTKIIIDQALANKDLSTLNIIIFIIIFIYILRSSVSFYMNYLFTLLNQKIITELKITFFGRIIRLPLSFYDNHQSSYLSARLNEINGLQTFFTPARLKIITGIFEFLFCFIVLLKLEMKLTLITLTILPILYIIIKYFKTGMRAYSRSVMEKGALINRNIQQSFAGIDIVKTSCTESYETRHLSLKLHDYLKLSINQTLFNNISSTSVGLVSTGLSVFVLWYFGNGIISDSLTIGTYFAFSGYLSKMLAPIQGLTSFGFSLQPAIARLHRVKELLDISIEEENGEFGKIEKLYGSIQLENLTFAYDTELVLKNVSIEISPGEKIALIGPSGSGKTTTVKLLLGLYRPQTGSIYFDNQNLVDLSLKTIRDRIGIISQNIFLFNDTITNNIKYSHQTASKDELLQAIEISGVGSFATELPNGMDTVVGEQGAKLSGGQKQMISIARTILKNPDILIMDEATSQLDSKREAIIQNIIKSVFKDKTCIIISHRLSSVKFAERLFVYDSGKIVQEGSYFELKNTPGKFKELFCNQLE